MSPRCLRFFCCLLLTMRFSFSYGQTTNQEFFPHHLGDIWQYFLNDGVSVDTLHVTVIRDSTDPFGNSHITQRARRINPDQPPGIGGWADTATYVLDTIDQLSRVYLNGTRSLLFRFRAVKGEFWRVGARFPWAIVDSIWTGSLFGRETTFKQISYYSSIHPIDTTRGLWLETNRVADGFGLVHEGGGELGHSLRLIGAVISGVVNGDTTLVSVSEKTQSTFPAAITLFQNYPNPFNSQTTIRFELPFSADINLTVCDILGKEVGRLINQQKMHAGRHQIVYNADLVSSGVYIYSLRTPTGTKSRRMLLIK